MFKKVLIVDDHEDVNKSVLDLLESLDIKTIIKSQYCDEAHLKIKRAKMDGAPFELLITDLLFKEDHRDEQLKSGEELVRTLKAEFRELKIIVYSFDDRLQKVRHLINDLQISAFVCKDRHGLKELKQAIKSVFEGELYVSPKVKLALNNSQDLEITNYDIELMAQLAKGLLQEQISEHFKSENISPGSVSSIEKRLNRLRMQFKAQNNTQLIAIVKDLGLI